MARAKFIEDEAFSMMLERAMAGTKEIAEKALRAGAAVIADRMKQNLEGILSPDATGELADAFGITPVKQDKNLNWNVHLGFDGYSTRGHVPFQLIARSFESGAIMGGRYTGRIVKGKREKTKAKFGPEDYWRKPTPFAKPAVQATKTQALEAMKMTVEKELEKLAADL